MKTRAAVCWDTGPGAHWEVGELELDPPGERELLIRWVAAGLCHSDEHLLTGDLPARLPLVGGHEGAGIVEEVGPGVTRVAPGDHVVCSFLPVCGTCRWCSTGRSNLCDAGATLLQGSLPSGAFRFHGRGQDVGSMCMLGSFAERSVVSEYSVVRVDDDLPLERAVLVGCGVPTGWGSSVYAAKVGPGDTVVIYGIGGVGINAVQGARHAGATNVVAVDPLAFKREKAEEMGATHSVATAEEAQDLVLQLTRGVGADSSIITVGVVDSVVVENAFNVIRKGGSLTITGLGPIAEKTIQLSGTMLTLFQKTVQGTMFGSSNPMYDISRMLELYRAGQVKLDELCTTTYSLDDINQGYQDLRDGRNIRGVIVHGQ
ncbi:MAG TPA: NDMA-dependent alcohol dehydrogenase [Candidatus Dormibacteraeota bacterium]|jgi:S-(hydroxymethyl)glutathione dehydrogenase/alcohol dehydrogenase|nr:NDMA-dependent alcohol dehydrogenase [Candidatus Dormibacteraeota bacterium]